jgi:prepilin-type N-terminal cleavage/methylation domain-containing protein
MHSQKGITLIELIIAIVIMLILTAVIALSMGNAFKKTKEASTKANLDALRKAVIAFTAEHDGRWPGFNAPATYSSDDFVNDMIPRYISRIPTCDTLKNGNIPNKTIVRILFARADRGQWAYNPVTGDLWVDCSHNSLSGIRWCDY